MIHSATFELKYKKILEDVLSTQQKIKSQFTLRTLRQPELKIEAFSLHNAKKTIIAMQTNIILNKRVKAYTLTEILVVLIIIGILVL